MVIDFVNVVVHVLYVYMNMLSHTQKSCTCWIMYMYVYIHAAPVLHVHVHVYMYVCSNTEANHRRKYIALCCQSLIKMECIAKGADPNDYKERYRNPFQVST